MKVILFIILCILVSCGSTQYVLHSKPEHFIIKNSEETDITSKNGVTLTYDRSPFVRVEGKDDKGNVRLFYKLILSNFSKSTIELGRKSIHLQDNIYNINYLAKFKKADKRLIGRKIKNSERLELEVIFDIDQKTIDKFEGTDNPLWISTKLKNGDQLKMKVWLWSL